MSDDEQDRKRREHEDDEPDVEAHADVTDDASELDPERKRRRRLHEDAEGDELGRRRR